MHDREPGSRSLATNVRKAPALWWPLASRSARARAASAGSMSWPMTRMTVAISNGYVALQPHLSEVLADGCPASVPEPNLRISTGTLSHRSIHRGPAITSRCWV